MKLRITIMSMVMIATASAFGGASNVELKCNTKNGLMIIKGDVPGDEAEFEMTIEHNGKSVRLFSKLNQSSSKIEENANIVTVQHLKNGVWTLVSNKKEGFGFVEMYALPKTVKHKSKKYGYEASFNGKISFNLSEIDQSTVEKDISCTLNYEI